MGVYKAAVVTESGQNLIAQAFTSEKKLIFTSAKTSSYSYPAGTNISALTGLQDVVQSVIPSGTKTIGGNVAQVTVRFDNDSIDQAYLIQTIGLYAKIEDGEETLFSVTQATVPDEMPVHSEVSPSAYIYNIQSTVQNASQITITVNPTGAASVQDFLDIQNPAFDDSGTSEEISSFPEFLDTVKSKMNFFQFFRNLKSGLQFVLHVGSIVNNCVTDNPNLPLSAAQGKALQDQLATLNSNINDKIYYLRPHETKTWTLRAPSFLMIGASNTTAALLYVLSDSFKVLSELSTTDLSTLISVSNYRVTITNPLNWGINVIMLYA